MPVLELEDGYNLTEGVVIQEYLADGGPEAKLAPPRGSRERLKLEELLLFLSTEIDKSFSPLFAPTTPDDYKSLAREKIGARFDLLEQRLSTGAPISPARVLPSPTPISSRWQLGTVRRHRPRQVAEYRPFMQRVAARPAVQAALEAEGLKKAA